MRYTIDPAFTNKSMSYQQYRSLINELLAEGKTTGTNQSPELFEYAKLNETRMKRVEKTAALLPETVEALSKINQTQHWFLLTEGWCGDAAQIVPVIAKMAEQNAHIQLHILLRDENLELMDLYLQNGKSRSIPKLIITDESFGELANWGPRPKALQEIYDEMRNNNADFEAIKYALHKWYHEDKTFHTQQEITHLIEVATNRKASTLAAL